MQVGADADAFADLAEVHGLVLVAQEGKRDLLAGVGKFRQRGGYAVEVLHRRQGDGNVCHAADLGRPDAGRGDNELCADVAAGGMHGGDAPICDSEAGHSDATAELCAGLLGRARHGRGGPGRFCLDVGGDVERAEDAVGEERKAGARLVRAEQVAVHAPGEAVAAFAFQVGETCGRPGDFEAADRFGARLAVQLHAGPKIDGAACEAGHGFGGVNLEDQARRVRC